MQIEFNQLSKQFEDGRLVLDKVSLSEDIRTLAIIGPSGCGKSTLLRILGGLLIPTSGTFQVGGEEITKENLLAYRKKIGFVFQQNGLFSHMNALDNIALPLCKVHGYTKEAAEQRAREVLVKFGLGDDMHKKPLQLSGGQQQRISIGRAISANPKFILLDEPTSALDPEYTTEVLTLVKELKEEGIQFIIVTHEMGFARHACDQLAFLYGGKIWEYGTSEAVFTNPQTEELQKFLGKLLEWNV
ncbi:MAG: ATP-binding cassette domain-containing protein [Eubacteriales bacterium]